MSDDTNVIDLFAAKPKARPHCSFEDADQALAAVRHALDKLAEACSVAGTFWPTSDEEWVSVARAGLRKRLRIIRGAQ